MIKISFKNTLIQVVNIKHKNTIARNPSDIILVDNDIASFKDVLRNHCSDSKSSKIFILTNNVLRFLWRIKKELKVVVAAGGLVVNDNNEILMIFRNGKWDLPKGKIDPNELIRLTALREVEEECGVANLTIVKKLEQSFHVYYEEGSYILKKTHWFHMFTNQKKRPEPQLEEGITKALWVKPKKIGKKFYQTYPNIQNLLESFLKDH